MISEFDIRLGELLKNYGLVENFQLDFLKGGKNNRVFKVTSEQGQELLLKSYFQHPEDPRNRLRTEFTFAKFAHSVGLSSVPEPLALDEVGGLGLYEYIDGRLLQSDEITEDIIQQSIDFYRELNQNKSQAQSLPLASEACFTLEEHAELVVKRLERLSAIVTNNPIDTEALTFVQSQLIPKWQSLSLFMRKILKEKNWLWKQTIPDVDRCVSPSDFGFHNALLKADGQVCFIDFEYAGWDDPAQMVCDFFSQVEVPVSMSWFPDFTNQIIETLSQPELHRERIELLLPLHQLKWCCIVLNDFLSVGDHRRQFSGEQSAQRKENQLKKAKVLLENIQF